MTNCGPTTWNATPNNENNGRMLQFGAQLDWTIEALIEKFYYLNANLWVSFIEVKIKIF